MAYIPSVNVMEVVLFGECGGQTIVSVHHFLYPAAITDLMLEDMADDTLSNWSTDMEAELSEDFIFKSVKCTDLTLSSGHVREAFNATTETGTVAQPAIANNACMVISQRTANRGRSSRGRTYHAGIPQTFLASPTEMVPANQAGAVAAWIELWGDMATVGASTHVVLSKQVDGGARLAGLAQPVLSVSGNAQLDSQRRRLAGRGV